MTDFTIGTKFTADASELIKALERISKLTAENKKQMEDFSKSSTASFSSIAKTMVRAEEARVKKEIASIQPSIEPATGKATYSEESKARIEQLKKGLTEYKTAVSAAQREVEASQKQHNSNMLKGQREYSNAVVALKKEESTAILEQAKKQREIDRQGLSGTELTTKAKEQSDAAVEAYQRANEAYKQQIEVRKSLSQQMSQSGDAATAKEKLLQSYPEWGGPFFLDMLLPAYYQK